MITYEEAKGLMDCGFRSAGLPKMFELAKEGDEKAILYLADTYSDIDPEYAYKLLESISDKNSSACVRIGYMWKRGYPYKSHKKAAEWFQKAIDMGSGFAKLCIADVL